jgi:hypothetical protein
MMCAGVPHEVQCSQPTFNLCGRQAALIGDSALNLQGREPEQMSDGTPTHDLDGGPDRKMAVVRRKVVRDEVFP